MTASLVDHPRVPGLPKPQNLECLTKVEATFLPYGGRWLVLDGEVEVLEGAWPGSVVSDLVLVGPAAPGLSSAAWAEQIRSAVAAEPTADGRNHDTSEERP